MFARVTCGEMFLSALNEMGVFCVPGTALSAIRCDSFNFQKSYGTDHIFSIIISQMKRLRSRTFGNLPNLSKWLRSSHKLRQVSDNVLLYLKLGRICTCM
jgi:hypothetical protein